MFFLEQSSTLYGHSSPDHPTIQILYGLAKELLEESNEKEQNFTDVIDVICSNNEKLLHKVENSLGDIPGTQTAKKIVSRALEFNRLAKRKYVFIEDSDSSLEPLPTCSIKKRSSDDLSSQEDLNFIVKYRNENVGKMSWKRCLEQAQEANVCKRFSTGESIRSFFYHATKK